MKGSNRLGFIVGAGMGITLAAIGGNLLAQTAAQSVKSETQYFVTGEGDDAHLWVREGNNLRCVGHGECKAHAHEGHDHREGDGHDHGKEGKKP